MRMQIPSPSGLVACRDCGQQISVNAVMCPHCGAPAAGKGSYGMNFEYKSKMTLAGLPVVHVAIGRDENHKLRVAKGIIAIGQFAKGIIVIGQFGVGVVCIAQFGLGFFCLGQFAIGALVLGQLAMGYSVMHCQIGLTMHDGNGLLLYHLKDVFR